MNWIQRTSKDLWQVVHDYGIGTGSITRLKLWIWTFVILIQQIQISIFIVVNWAEPNLRYQGMEDFECCLSILILLPEFCFAPDHIVTTLKMIDKGYYDYKMNNTEEKMKVIEKGRSVMTNQSVFLCYSLLLFHSLLVVPPISGGIYATLKKGDNEKVSYETALTMDSWYPFEIDLKIYLFLCLYNLFFHVTAYRLAALYLNSNIYALHCVATDINLLNVAIFELDRIIGLSKRNNSGNEDYFTKEVDNKLRIYTRQLIVHHNIICKKIKVINKVGLSCSLNVTQFVSLIGCVTLYRFFEATVFIEKMHHAFAFLFLMGMTFGLSYNGQAISNMSENLRNALYNCEWLEKPLWFKKALLHMMTRAYRDLEIKPLGLYVLNFNSYNSMVNAAYAYCNFLRTLRD